MMSTGHFCFLILCTVMITVDGGRLEFNERPPALSSKAMRDAGCDPLGTLQTRYGIWGDSCYCKRYFYGEKCERIHRCRSGQPANVTCANPPNMFSTDALERCFPDQELLEVCVCFPGYHGPLCANYGNPRAPVLPNSFEENKMDQLRISPQYQHELDMQEIHRRLYGDDQLVIDRRMHERSSPTYKQLVFAVNLLMFLTSIYCAQYIVKIICRRRKNARNQRVYNLVHQPMSHPDNVNCNSLLPTPPPSYDDAVRRFKEVIQEDETIPPQIELSSLPTSSSSSSSTNSPLNVEETPKNEEENEEEIVVIVERKMFTHV